MPPKKPRKSYDPKIIKQAVKDVINKKGRLREIAQKYGIPKSTLHFRVKYPGHRTSFGPPPILTAKEEESLENWIFRLAETGFPIKKGDIQYSVQKILDENPRLNSFKDNYPGIGWLRGYFKRHPAIAALTNEAGTQSSADFSESNIRKWFSDIHDYLDKNDLIEVINDPSRIFIGDETYFQLRPDTGKNLAVRESKSYNVFESNNGTESLTVMYTFSADGFACPPLVIYDYERIPQKVAKSIPLGWAITRSENGLMNSELFFNYISNVFHPYLMEKNVTTPVIFFVDPYKTHVTFEISKLCRTLNIEIIALYPNVTRVLLSADRAVFRPVKAAWKKASRKWLMRNLNDSITRNNFAEVLNIGLKNLIKTKYLANAFRECGLFPFNPENIDYRKFLVKNKRWPQELSKLQPLKSNNIITMSKFTGIIGTKKITEIETCENVTERDENFQLLYKLYNALKGYPIYFNKTIQMPPISDNSANRSNETKEDKDYYLEEEYLEDIISSDESENSSESQMPTDRPRKFLATESTAVTKRKSKEYRETIATLNITPNTIRFNIDERTPSSDPAFKTMYKSLLGTYLSLTKALERKGKKTSEEPREVSSKDYSILNRHNFTKDMEPGNKVKRFKNQIDKDRNNEPTVNVDDATDMCAICSKATDSNDRVKCCVCSLIYHLNCVPRMNQERNSEKTYHFVCHKCVEDYVDHNASDDEDEKLIIIV